MNDAVLGYHLNPFGCGVAKFNVALAQRLSIPYASIEETSYHYPLWSVKASEVDSWPLLLPDVFDVLWHDRGLKQITRAARRVFYAEEIGCPSTVDGDATRGAYRVLVFGMAHKLLLPHFVELKAVLDRDHPDYTIELSTAVHEGHPWDVALAESTAMMRDVFGPRLRVLGFIADDGLARLLTEVDAVAAFYLPALRANNTTAWAAIAAGKRLFTNRDEASPTEVPTWEALVRQLVAPVVSTTTR